METKSGAESGFLAVWEEGRTVEFKRWQRMAQMAETVQHGNCGYGFFSGGASLTSVAQQNMVTNFVGGCSCRWWVPPPMQTAPWILGFWQYIKSSVMLVVDYAVLSTTTYQVSTI